MNNHRLLIGLLTAAGLSSGVVCGYSQAVISLDELFEYAESHSAQLKPVFTSQDVSRYEIQVAKAARLPEITATMQVSFLGDGFTTARSLSDYQKAAIPHLGTGMGINIDQPLYTGGAISGAIEMAELKSIGERFALDLQRDNLRIQLAGFYLDLYKYKNLRIVVEHNIEAANKVLDEMKARYSQGTAIANDITRYELLISNLELQLIRIDNTIDLFNHNLVTVAGLPTDTQIIPDTALISTVLPAASEAEWKEKATVNSPQIMLARNNIDLSVTAEKLTHSDYLPKIGLQAGWTIDGPILVEVPPINRNLSYWWVGLGLKYNLSSLYKNNKAMRKRRAETLTARERYDAAVDNVNMAVRADYLKYLEAYEELKTMDKSVELARMNYRVTSTRYSADMALITDMLDAANALLDAEQQLVNSKINIIYSYYKLLFTTGTI
ncbi:MAG: TolC family protein [Paramuribaculum sp.]|nr:TolC family protein [Paramuribaculum sp.]